ncbi:TPA: hypothetical protein JS222_004677 [Escherichia coli]|nr:hypothetical protein [Escherichia coli]HAX9914224.1 hypothetical protein [Escherichia coli]HAY0060391.1 hypothetical protein [Escherichia coli]HDQ4891916.1 hypothetical protein [Escherichia coli]
MKKTLIALAVAASAAVSGSAMAWTANGTGGSVDLGGTLTPVEKITPWEVKVGAAVNGLDGTIQKGQKEVRIETKTAIPVLGIRTQTTQAFQGQTGISPQISYGNAVNVAEFSKGIAPLTLEVKDANDAKIGTATTSILAAALMSYKNGNSVDAKSLYASVSGKGFFGGIGKNAEAVAAYPVAATSGFFAEASQNYTEQGAPGGLASPGETSFAVNGATYSGFYASGIEQGKTIKITLDTPASADAIVWKASLPVTVSYQ